LVAACSLQWIYTKTNVLIAPRHCCWLCFLLAAIYLEHEHSFS
jgi:hypothetical protein